MIDFGLFFIVAMNSGKVNDFSGMSTWTISSSRPDSEEPIGLIELEKILLPSSSLEIWSLVYQK